jgi:hypothetical protein
VLRALSFEAPTLFFGGPDLSKLHWIPLPNSSASVPWSGAGAGDWNGDGYADLIAAEYSWSAPAEGDAVGVAHIYLGGPAPTFAYSIDVRAPEGTTAVEFGAALTGGMDMNGDGLSDVAVLDGDEGRIHAIFGSAAGAARINASLTTGAPCHWYDRAMLLAAGDLNGDGFGDLAALCRPGALVYLGALTPALTPSWSVKLQPREIAIAGGQDLGLDGYADLLIGAGEGSGTVLHLLAGSAAFSNTSELVPFGGALGAAGELASYGLTVGDHDGDGRWDVAAQVYNASRIRWFSGASGASSPMSCTQPEASFEMVGNWCAAPTQDVDGFLTRTDSDGTPYQYPIGTSFGHVLGR